MILSLLICIGVKFGLILPLYQLLPELKYYTQGYRGFLWEWIGYALSWDLLVTNLIDAATRNPVACLLLGVFIHVNYKKKIDTTLWFNLIHKWIQSLYILVVFFIQQRRKKRKPTGMTRLGSPGVSSQSVSGFFDQNRKKSPGPEKHPKWLLLQKEFNSGIRGANCNVFLH